MYTANGRPNYKHFCKFDNWNIQLHVTNTKSITFSRVKSGNRLFIHGENDPTAKSVNFALQLNYPDYLHGVC